MEITITKGEPYQEYCAWYSRIITRTPIFWKGEDGVEHFIVNLSGNMGSAYDESRERRELDRKVAILKANGCRFLPVYLKDAFTTYPKEDVEAFLKWKSDNGYTFSGDFTSLRWEEEEQCFNFLGNLKECSAAFWFRIYDKSLAERCRQAMLADGVADNPETEASPAFNAGNVTV